MVAIIGRLRSSPVMHRTRRTSGDAAAAPPAPPPAPDGLAGQEARSDPPQRATGPRRCRGPRRRGQGAHFVAKLRGGQEVDLACYCHQRRDGGSANSDDQRGHRSPHVVRYRRAALQDRRSNCHAPWLPLRQRGVVALLIQLFGPAAGSKDAGRVAAAGPRPTASLRQICDERGGPDGCPVEPSGPQAARRRNAHRGPDRPYAPGRIGHWLDA
jgi:hypothetical protein